MREYDETGRKDVRFNYWWSQKSSNFEFRNTLRLPEEENYITIIENKKATIIRYIVQEI